MPKQNELGDDSSVIDETSDEIVPYKYSITSYGADYPVDGLVKRLDNEVIFVPQFQRSYVWSITQASRFIESLLLGLPVPGIFLSKEPDTGRMLVIDGQQRLRTLQFFYQGLFQGREFRLKDVQPQFEGKTYRTLEEGDRRRLDDSIIHATIVKQDEPSDDQSSIFHIFKRLNTGGMLLQDQEIRACIFHGLFNDLLRDLNNNKSWRLIYGAPSKRLKDQELILRYFALYFRLSQYERPMKEFLNTYMGANKNLQLQDSDVLTKAFVTVIDSVGKTLGDKAFRVHRPLNAAVFDAVMVGLRRRLDQGPVRTWSDLVEAYNALLNQDAFKNATSTGTSDATNVQLRIKLATQAFQQLQ